MDKLEATKETKRIIDHDIQQFFMERSIIKLNLLKEYKKWFL